MIEMPGTQTVIQFSKEDCLQRDFLIYHHDNPHIYLLLVKFTRQVKATGREFYSMKTIVARLRWHLAFEVKNAEGLELKLNDRWVSRYARLIMENEPDLNGFFKTRVLRGHYKHRPMPDESREQYIERAQAFQDSRNN